MLRQHGLEVPALPGGVLWDSLRALPVPVKELIAGGVAGGTAKTAVAPLERAKILFQTGKLRGAALGPTLRSIYSTEGVPGLFRGNGASVLRIVPYAAVHFWCYEHYRRLLVAAEVLGAQEHRVPPALDLLAGSAAGGTAVVLTYPLDLVRTRLAFMTEAGGTPRSSSGGGGGGGSRMAGAAAAGSQARGAAARSPVAALRAALAAAAQSSSSSAGSGGSSSGLAARPPYVARYSGAGLLLCSSRGCSSGACVAGRNGLSSAAARLAAGLPLPTSSISSGSCSARAQGQAVAAVRPLHSLALARPHHQPHHTIRSILLSTLRNEGVRGLYHGVGASMYGILPYAGLKFFAYQHLKQWYHHTRPRKLTRTGVDGKPRLPVPVMLTFGGVAGLVAQTATYPLDVVRRQMQVEGLRLAEAAASSPTAQLSAGTQQLSLRSAPQALVLLARTHGWRCLYAGLSINYMKVVPSTAIGFTLYDYCKSALALPTNL